MSFTNAQLATKISDLIAYWSSFNEEYSNWLGGAVDGGPGSDGKYPLTDYDGDEALVDSPAKLADNVSGYVGLASGYADDAAASASAASTSESNASTSASTATTQAALADADRIAAETAESGAVDAKVTAIAQAVLTAIDAAATAADLVLTNADVVLTGIDVIAAAASAAAAAQSAADAATFDPDLFAELSTVNTFALAQTFTATPIITSGLLNLNAATARLQRQGQNFISSNATTVNIGPMGATDLAVTPGAVVVTGTLNVTGQVDFGAATLLLNNQRHWGKDSGAANRNLIGVSTADLVELGDVNLGGVKFLDGSIYGASGNLMFLDSSDGWLRINNSSTFTNGIYTPGILRVDGNLYIGGGSQYMSAGKVINHDAAFSWGDHAAAGYQAGGSYQTDIPILRASGSAQVQIESAAPFLLLKETGVTGTPVWWWGADGGSFNLRLNNTGSHGIQFITNAGNDAITSVNIPTVLTVAGALTAASFGGVLSANLVDKTATETISGVRTWTNTTYFSAVNGPRLGNETYLRGLNAASTIAFNLLGINSSDVIKFGGGGYNIDIAGNTTFADRMVIEGAAAGGAQNSSLTLHSSNVQFTLDNSASATDSRVWNWIVTGSQMKLRLLDDAYGNAFDFLTMTRSTSAAVSMHIDTPLTVGNPALAIALIVDGGASGNHIAEFRRDVGGAADVLIAMTGSSGLPAILMDRDLGQSPWAFGMGAANEFAISQDSAGVYTTANQRFWITSSGQTHVANSFYTVNGRMEAGDGATKTRIDYAGLYTDRQASYFSNTHASGSNYHRAAVGHNFGDTVGVNAMEIDTVTKVVTLNGAVNVSGLLSGSNFDASVGMTSPFYSLDATSGNGIKFWGGNSNYSIFMSLQADGTWGGRLDSTSDYNMYFRMSGGTNRGFVFQTDTNVERFSINPDGIRSRVDFYMGAAAGVDSVLALGDYSTTNMGILKLRGSSANVEAILKCTNGNLHMDANGAQVMYLNYYGGTGGIYFGTGASGSNANVDASGKFTMTNLDVTGPATVTTLSPSVGLIREAHHTGHLVGSYNNIAANSLKSNPIYTIGSSYNPLDAGLSNMYGIGYCGSSATFINSTDLGVDPGSVWGQYVAADGNARIFFDAANGRGYFKSHVYADQGIFRGDISAANIGNSADRTQDNIVTRGVGGYIFTNYLNMTANDTAAMPTQIAVETANDGYLRWQSPDDFKTNLGLGGGAGAVNKVKTADTVKTTDAAYTDDPHLHSWDLEAGEYYKVTGCLFVIVGASTTPNFRFVFGFSENPVLDQRRLMMYGTDDTNPPVQFHDSASITTGFLVDINSNKYVTLNITGFFQANATTGGDVSFTWGQGTSSGFATTLKDGSWISIEKVS